MTLIFRKIYVKRNTRFSANLIILNIQFWELSIIYILIVNI